MGLKDDQYKCEIIWKKSQLLENSILWRQRHFKTGRHINLLNVAFALLDTSPPTVNRFRCRFPEFGSVLSPVNLI